MTDVLLQHGSMLLVLAWLICGGLGLPLPEDVALLATGALVARGAVPAAVGLGVAALGVLGGDVLLFLVARRLGPAAYERPLFRRWLSPERRYRIEAAYRAHGGRIVFLARHAAGVRAATFALAGIHGMPLRRFVAWDALATTISLPVVVGLGYVGAAHLDRVRTWLSSVEHAVLVGLACVVLVVLARGWIVSRRRRHRAIVLERVSHRSE